MEGTTTTTKPSGYACGACGQTFPTLDETFTHPCDTVPQWMADRVGGAFQVPTSRGDNVDAPERHESTGTRSERPARAPRTNRYAGQCTRCGGRVEAEQGVLVRNHAGGSGGAATWDVTHRQGECATPAPARPVVDTPDITAPPAGPAMSGPQEQLLRSLIAERQTAHPMDADEAVAAFNTLPDPAAAARVLIDHLMKLPRREAEATPEVDDRRANRYPGKCVRCGEWIEAEAGKLVKTAAGWGVDHPAGPCPVAPAPAADVEPAGPVYEPEKGDVHVVDGDYYRVHIDQGSRRPYAVRWDTDEWVYAAGALRRCSTETLATAEDAARFGELYHACVFCTRPLDTPESTAVGYGPVCAAKRGLPWG